MYKLNKPHNFLFMSKRSLFFEMSKIHLIRISNQFPLYYKKRAKKRYLKYAPIIDRVITTSSQIWILYLTGSAAKIRLWMLPMDELAMKTLSINFSMLVLIAAFRSMYKHMHTDISVYHKVKMGINHSVQRVIRLNF